MAEKVTLYVFGCGGGAVETFEDGMLEYKGLRFTPTDFVFVEDEPKSGYTELFGHKFPVIATDELKKYKYGLITAFTPTFKERIDKKFPDMEWVNAIARITTIPPKHGFIGVNIRAFVFIGNTAELGRHVKVNFHSVIPHNCVIGDYCFISHNVAMSAKVTVGKGSIIYENSTILPGVTIGENTVIGAGSMVTKDIPSNVIAYGNPCKVVRDND